MSENQEFAQLTDAQWRERLNPAEYEVLRQAGTEMPFTGELLSENREGIYSCRGLRGAAV